MFRAPIEESGRSDKRIPNLPKLICPNCSTLSSPEVNFCISCGFNFQSVQLDKVLVDEARVPYASQSIDETPSDFYLTPRGSDFQKNAGCKFEKSEIPIRGDLVPADCIWSCFEHPGYLRPSSRGQSLISKYQQISVYRGRTLVELESYFGKCTVSMENDSIKSVVWSEASLTKIWQIQFYFDKYDVCIDVGEVITQ